MNTDRETRYAEQGKKLEKLSRARETVSGRSRWPSALESLSKKKSKIYSPVIVSKVGVEGVDVQACCDDGSQETAKLHRHQLPHWRLPSLICSSAIDEVAHAPQSVRAGARGPINTSGRGFRNDAVATVAPFTARAHLPGFWRLTLPSLGPETCEGLSNKLICIRALTG